MDKQQPNNSAQPTTPSTNANITTTVPGAAVRQGPRKCDTGTTSPSLPSGVVSENAKIAAEECDDKRCSPSRSLRNSGCSIGSLVTKNDILPEQSTNSAELSEALGVDDLTEVQPYLDNIRNLSWRIHQWSLLLQASLVTPEIILAKAQEAITLLQALSCIAPVDVKQEIQRQLIKTTAKHGLMEGPPGTGLGSLSVNSTRSTSKPNDTQVVGTNPTKGTEGVSVPSVVDTPKEPKPFSGSVVNPKPPPKAKPPSNSLKNPNNPGTQQKECVERTSGTQPFYPPKTTVRSDSPQHNKPQSSATNTVEPPPDGLTPEIQDRLIQILLSSQPRRDTLPRIATPITAPTPVLLSGTSAIPLVTPSPPLSPTCSASPPASPTRHSPHSQWYSSSSALAERKAPQPRRHHTPRTPAYCSNECLTSHSQSRAPQTSGGGANRNHSKPTTNPDDSMQKESFSSQLRNPSESFEELMAKASQVQSSDFRGQLERADLTNQLISLPMQQPILPLKRALPLGSMGAAQMLNQMDLEKQLALLHRQSLEQRTPIHPSHNRIPSRHRYESPSPQSASSGSSSCSPSPVHSPGSVPADSTIPPPTERLQLLTELNELHRRQNLSLQCPQSEQFLEECTDVRCQKRRKIPPAEPDLLQLQTAALSALAMSPDGVALCKLLLLQAQKQQQQQQPRANHTEPGTTALSSTTGQPTPHPGVRSHSNSHSPSPTRHKPSAAQQGSKRIQTQPVQEIPSSSSSPSIPSPTHRMTGATAIASSQQPIQIPPQTQRIPPHKTILPLHNLLNPS